MHHTLKLLKRAASVPVAPQPVPPVKPAPAKPSYGVGSWFKDLIGVGQPQKLSLSLNKKAGVINWIGRNSGRLLAGGVGAGVGYEADAQINPESTASERLLNAGVGAASFASLGSKPYWQRLKNEGFMQGKVGPIANAVGSKALTLAVPAGFLLANQAKNINGATANIKNMTEHWNRMSDRVDKDIVPQVTTLTKNLADTTGKVGEVADSVDKGVTRLGDNVDRASKALETSSKPINDFVGKLNHGIDNMSSAAGKVGDFVRQHAQGIGYGAAGIGAAAVLYHLLKRRDEKRAAVR